MTQYLDIPTTWAPYKEFDKWCPWSMIEHTCPSNIAWLPTLDVLQHLFRRAWQQDDGKDPIDEVRSDGMVWNRFKLNALCGAAIWIPYTKLPGPRALMRRHKACLECWEMRW